MFFPTASKYRNHKTTTAHGSFDSKGEARRYSELEHLSGLGRISDLKRQVRFTLQEKFKGPDGKTVRAIVFVADFTYTEMGRQIVEDFKGVRTAVFKMKKKMFQAKYPDMEFRETRAK